MLQGNIVSISPVLEVLENLILQTNEVSIQEVNRHGYQQMKII